MGKKSDPSTAVPTAVPAPASILAPPLAAVPPPADVTTDGAPKKAAAPKKAPVKEKPAKKKKPVRVKLSTEDIALRAYFIAEHRHHHGIHGDAHSDWIEAERQLKAELKKKKG